MMMPEPMLSISHLHVAIGDKAILKGLTLVLAGVGQVVTGPNGAGMCYADARGEPG